MDRLDQRTVLVALLLAVAAGGAAGAIAGWRDDPEPVVVAASAPITAEATIPAPGVADVPAIAEAIAPSVVAVEATVEADDPATGSLVGEATGTGFVIGSNGMIATAAHVIDDAWSTWVRLADGTRLPARVVGRDDATDLAVLTVDRTDLVPVTFGQTSAVRVGEPVIAIGHALRLGSTPTVSVGVVSALERTITGTNGTTYDHLLQTDAAINTGHSGGPLLNQRGEVIGINTSRITSADAEGLGFAICTDHALPALEALRAR